MVPVQGVVVVLTALRHDDELGVEPEAGQGCGLGCVVGLLVLAVLDELALEDVLLELQAGQGVLWPPVAHAVQASHVREGAKVRQVQVREQRLQHGRRFKSQNFNNTRRLPTLIKLRQ